MRYSTLCESHMQVRTNDNGIQGCLNIVLRCHHLGNDHTSLVTRPWKWPLPPNSPMNFAHWILDQSLTFYNKSIFRVDQGSHGKATLQNLSHSNKPFN